MPPQLVAERVSQLSQLQERALLVADTLSVVEVRIEAVTGEDTCRAAGSSSRQQVTRDDA